MYVCMYVCMYVLTVCTFVSSLKRFHINIENIFCSSAICTYQMLSDTSMSNNIIMLCTKYIHNVCMYKLAIELDDCKKEHAYIQYLRY